jgi:hypothetical protein
MNWTLLTTSPDNGGSSVTKYVILWDSGLNNGVYTEMTVILDTAQTSYTKNGLTQGTTYKFKIEAHNIYGAGPQSAVLEIIPASVPDAPTALTLVSSSHTQIAFSWTAPYNGGYPITSYKVYWDNNTNGATFTLATSVSGVTQVTVSTGVQAGNFYRFKVAAVNQIGEGAQSESASFIAAVVPDPPTSVHKTA